MAKQKVVVSISMKDQKARAKALKIAVGLSGVDSASAQTDKSQLEVVGEIDPVTLVNLLRKSLCQAELVNVSAVDNPKPTESPKPVEPAETPNVPICPPFYCPPPYYYPYPVVQDYQYGCTIL